MGAVAAGLLLVGILFAALVYMYRYTSIIDRSVGRLVNVLVDHNLSVQFEDISGNPFTGLEVTNLIVVTRGDTFQVPSLQLRYRLSDWLQKRVAFQSIVLVNPSVKLTLPSSAMAEHATVEPVLDTLRIYRAVEGLPVVDLKRIVVRNGQLILQGSSRREVFQNIQMELSVLVGRHRVEVKPRYIKARWEGHRTVLEDVSFSLIGTRKRITLNQFEARLSEGRLVGHGEVEFFPRLRFFLFADTSTVDLALVHQLVPRLPYRKGRVTVYGSFMGTREQFHGELFLRGRLDGLRIDRFHTWYRKRGREYRLEELELAGNFGSMRGEILYSPSSRNAARVRFSGVDLHKLGLLRNVTQVNGWLQLEFDTWQLNRISGKGNLWLNGLQAGQARLDSVKLTLVVRQGDWRFLRPSRVVVGPGSVFYLKGSLSRQGQLQANLVTQENCLDTLFAHLGWPTLGGSGALQVAVSGPVGNPRLLAKLHLDTLTAPGLALFGVAGQVNMQRIVTHPSGTLDLHLAAGRLRAMPITEGRALFRVNNHVVDIDTVQFKSHQNTIFTRGQLLVRDDSLELVLSDILFRYRDYLVRNSGFVLLNYGNRRLHFARMELETTGEGTISLSGTVDLEGESNLVAEVHQVRLEPFNQFINWRYALSGEVDARVALKGALSHPQGRCRVWIRDLALDPHPLGSIQARLEVSGQQFTLERFQFIGPKGARVHMSGTAQLVHQYGQKHWHLDPDTPVKVNIEMDSLQVEPYLFLFAVNYPIQGRLNGSIQMEGTLNHPVGRFLLDFHDLQIREYRFPNAHLDGRFNHNRMLLDFGKINFMDTDLIVNGYKTINWDLEHPERMFSDRRFKAHVVIKEDSVNFLNVFLPDVDRILGQIRADLWLGGDITDPQVLKVEAEIENGILYLSKLENPIRELSARATVDENGWLQIERFQGVSRKKAGGGSFFRKFLRLFTSPIASLLGAHRPAGEVELTGRMNVRHLLRPRFDLTLRLEEAYVNYFVENVRLLLSARNLRITGQDTIVVTGNVKIEEGDVDVDFSQTEKNVLLSSKVREEPPFLQYSLDVEIPGNFFVRSQTPFNTFDLQLSGNVRISKRPREPIEMFGVLLIRKGTYFVQIEHFDIQNGKIEFVNPKEVPEIEIFAQRRKYGLIFDLTVRGKLNNPQKEIRIWDARTNQELPYTDVKDQMALLMFGVPFDQLGASGQDVLLSKGQEVLYQTAASLIEREARHFIGLDEVRIESYSAFQSRRLNQSSRLALGKYLTPSLYLEFKTALGGRNIPSPQLNWEAGNQIYLEYRLSRGFTISTLYEQLTEQSNRVKLDISWRYEF